MKRKTCYLISTHVPNLVNIRSYQQVTQKVTSLMQAGTPLGCPATQNKNPSPKIQFTAEFGNSGVWLRVCIARNRFFCMVGSSIRKRTNVEHTALREDGLTCYLLERTGGGLRAVWEDWYLRVMETGGEWRGGWNKPHQTQDPEPMGVIGWTCHSSWWCLIYCPRHTELFTN